MSAIILEILKNNPNKIFTQTEIIDEIENRTGKRKSKSAISQNIKTLSNRNKINYEKGLGRKPAKISLMLSDIEKPKPKPIKSKPKPIIESKPEFNLSQLSQAEITATNGLKEFSNEIKQEIKEVFTLEKDYNETIKSLQFAEETIIQQKEEITNLEVEMAFAKGIRKRPFTFKEFSEYMLSQSKSSGSNSMKLGEIAYRKTSLKNIFLIILHLRDVNQL